MVTFGLLSLSRPNATSVAPATTVTLTGKVRGVKGTVRSSSRRAATPGRPARRWPRRPTARFSVAVAPQQTTRFRLSAPGCQGPAALRARSRGAAAADRAAAPSSAGARSRARSSRRPARRAAVVPRPRPRLRLLAGRCRRCRRCSSASSTRASTPAIPSSPGKIASTRSFVGGSVDDQIGHGTFVAGEIAAALGNGQGIAGIAFPAQLIVAKVIGSDGTIDPAVEAKAIRWEVDRGAKVINLSLGAVRDPPIRPSTRTRPSRPRRSGTRRATASSSSRPSGTATTRRRRRGRTRATRRRCHTSSASARWRRTAPSPRSRTATRSSSTSSRRASAILSTFPRSLTAQRATCADQGYSDCASRDYRDGAGTSFAVPQVTATAALAALGLPRPDAGSADDDHRALGRRRHAGHGLLALPRRPRLALGAGQPRHRGGARRPRRGRCRRPTSWSRTTTRARIAPRLWGSATVVRATVDYWDDPVDVYAVRVRAGERLSVAAPRPGAQGPPARALEAGNRARRRQVGPAHVASAVPVPLRAGPYQSLGYRAPVSGWYDVEVRPDLAGRAARTRCASPRRRRVIA